MIVMEIFLIFFIALTVHLNAIIMLCIFTFGLIILFLIIVWFERKHVYRVEINSIGITWVF